MKSYVWLQTTDGSIQQVEEEVAMFCPMICREVLQSGMGSSKNYAISLPQRVNPAILSLILDYCRFHQVPGRSNKERKSFDEKFIRIDTKRLCELTSAADSLQLKPLVDLTSRALARMIEGKTPEEIRETFHLPDDLTEEEKLEPLRNTADDPRIRLLNRLYARKRKELKEKEKLKELDALSSDSHVAENGNVPSPSRTPKLQDVTDDAFSPEIDFDYDIDDELDPAMKEELDREVEDFARRLNSDWPERMQEILSLGQEGRSSPISLNGNGCLRRYSRKLR
ncbi:SKP1-like protein 21 [Ranunculus cassubicifolius]